MSTQSNTVLRLSEASLDPYSEKGNVKGLRRNDKKERKKTLLPAQRQHMHRQRREQCNKQCTEERKRRQ